ncbi:hypothetical protein ACF0H5_015344 [Mactra antiquata]
MAVTKKKKGADLTHLDIVLRKGTICLKKSVKMISSQEVIEKFNKKSYFGVDEVWSFLNSVNKKDILEPNCFESIKNIVN